MLAVLDVLDLQIAIAKNAKLISFYKELYVHLLVTVVFLEMLD